MYNFFFFLLSSRQGSQTANFAVAHTEVGRETRTYISGEESLEAVSLCDFYHGMRRF